MLKFLFFLSFLIVFYSYIGYGILLYLIVKLRRLFSSETGQQLVSDFEPEVTLVVSAYNEAGFIERKIRTAWNLTILQANSGGFLLQTGLKTGRRISYGNPTISSYYTSRTRKGKVAAMNRAIKYVETPYVIFSDANTLLNTGLCPRNRETLCRPAGGGGGRREKNHFKRER